LFIAARDIDCVEQRPRIAAGVAAEHQDLAVEGECRPLVEESLGEDPLAPPVNAHDADRKGALACFVNAMRSPRGDHTGVE
jgi:hypothetical protein